MRLPFTKKTSETKASAAGGLLALTGLARAKWTGRRYDAQIEEGFRKNVIVWRCVTMVADAVAHIPFVLYDTRGKIVGNHPVLKLLARVFAGYLLYRAGQKDAALDQLEQTATQRRAVDDARRAVDALPDAAVTKQLQQHWTRD